MYAAFQEPCTVFDIARTEKGIFVFYGTIHKYWVLYSLFNVTIHIIPTFVPYSDLCHTCCEKQTLERRPNQHVLTLQIKVENLLKSRHSKICCEFESVTLLRALLVVSMHEVFVQLISLYLCSSSVSFAALIWFAYAGFSFLTSFEFVVLCRKWTTWFVNRTTANIFAYFFKPPSIADCVGTTYEYEGGSRLTWMWQEQCSREVKFWNVCNVWPAIILISTSDY
jgi:hypothetical protein